MILFENELARLRRRRRTSGSSDPQGYYAPNYSVAKANILINPRPESELDLLTLVEMLIIIGPAVLCFQIIKASKHILLVCPNKPLICFLFNSYCRYSSHRQGTPSFTRWYVHDDHINKLFYYPNVWHK